MYWQYRIYWCQSVLYLAWSQVISCTKPAPQIDLPLSEVSSAGAKTGIWLMTATKFTLLAAASQSNRPAPDNHRYFLYSPYSNYALQSPEKQWFCSHRRRSNREQHLQPLSCTVINEARVSFSCWTLLRQLKGTLLQLGSVLQLKKIWSWVVRQKCVLLCLNFNLLLSMNSAVFSLCKMPPLGCRRSHLSVRKAALELLLKLTKTYGRVNVH